MPELDKSKEVLDFCQKHSVPLSRLVDICPNLFEAAEHIIEDLKEEELAYICDDDELQDYHGIMIQVSKLRNLRAALQKIQGEG